MIRILNNIKTNINPTQTEQGTYQKHGLRAIDRKPNDYLRMVARTFSSFRNTPTNDTVVSYINGFDITYDPISVTEVHDWLEVGVDYNLFTVKAGVCMIDNQLIDIFEDSKFYFKKGALPEDGGLQNSKYAVVVEYDYLEQYDDHAATIRFIPYGDLTFPRLDDLNVVQCKYIDQSLDGILNVSELSGRPGLVIATFTSNELGEITRSELVSGETVLKSGIDPQLLSKLYIQNYKLLFDALSDQAQSVYSSMGMTQATFLSVTENQLDIGLKSGDMCYLDPDTMTYKRSVASRQKFSKVVGLYINTPSAGTHIIYLSGIVSLDADKHNLAIDHTLVTMSPGQHYFLEDDSSLFDTNHPTMTIDNYTLADSSGRITPEFYPSAVRVGYSTACNQIILNIDHALEIGAGHLLGLFGNFEQYKTEYLANSVSLGSDAAIVFAQEQNVRLQDEVNIINTTIGPDNYSEIVTWTQDLNSQNFNYLMYDVINNYFANGTNLKAIAAIAPVVPQATLDLFDTATQTAITTGLNSYRTLSDIDDLIKTQLSADNQLLTIKKATNADYSATVTTNDLAILNIKLRIARLKLFDNPDNTETFENRTIDMTIDSTVYDYSAQIITLTGDYNALITANKALTDTYMSNQETINDIASMIARLEALKINIETLIDASTLKSQTMQDEITANEIEILSLLEIKADADSRILTTDALRLDIFLMDEHQRNVFNYTYITDRLRRRLYLVEQLQSDLLKVKTYNQTVIDTTEPDTLERFAASQEVVRVENLIATNESLISNYTDEYNRIRVEIFAIAPIVRGDKDFNDGGYSDQRIGTYRYGCDPDDAYNGLANNYISPCPGNAFISFDPYITPSYLTELDFTGTTGGITSDLTIEIGGNISVITLVDNGIGKADTWSYTTPTLVPGDYILSATGSNADGLEYIRTTAVTINEVI